MNIVIHSLLDFDTGETRAVKKEFLSKLVQLGRTPIEMVEVPESQISLWTVRVVLD